MASVKDNKLKGDKRRITVRYDGEPNPETGERKQLQKTFKSIKEANEFIALITLGKNEQPYPFLQVYNQPKEEEHLQVPFKVYATNWFEVDYYQQVRANTFKTRRFYLEKHVIPFFNDKPLSSITADDIKGFYAQLKRDGYAEKTISTIHKFISTLFKSAFKNGQSNPMLAIEKKPKDPIRIANPWTFKEENQFLELAEQEGKDVMYGFTLDTGLREGEVFALPWFNLDLEHKTVTVTRSVSYDEKGVPELIPKAPSSYRTLYLTDSIVEKLRKHKEKQDEMKKRFGPHYHHELDLVFPVYNGGFQNPSNVRRQLYRLMDKAKVRRITFHDLRHTHASMLIRSGAQPRVVQAQLGHKDIETTFRYYGHLWPNADQQAIRNLEKERNKHKNQKDDKNQM
jgi:integrase